MGRDERGRGRPGRVFALVLGDCNSPILRNCGGVLFVSWCVVSLPFTVGRDPTLKKLPEKLADFVFNSHWKRDCKKSACSLGLESKATSSEAWKGQGGVSGGGGGFLPEAKLGLRCGRTGLSHSGL